MGGRVYVPETATRDAARSMFGYELESFRSATDLLFADPPREYHNALLESALVHARNLHDFFCHRPSDCDDVIAAHYLPASGAASLPECLDYLKSCQRAINKSLAHLTYHRTEAKPEWDFGLMRYEVETAHAVFLSRLPADERWAWPAPCDEAFPLGDYEVS